MRKHLPHVFLLFFLFLATSLFAQVPEKFTYQAVVRDPSNQLVTNAPVGVRVSLLQGGTNGTVLYMETHSTVTNVNGLVTIVIGSGNLLQGSISGIDWAYGPIFLHTEIDPAGGTNYTVTSTQQLLSVPYALYASEAANGFSGNYNDLTNAPQIPTVPANVSAFANDAGYITGYTETDPLYNAWDKDYNDLINKPVIPTVPTNVSAFTNDANYITVQDIPEPPTVPTNVSAFTNDVPYLIEEQQTLSISNDTLFLTGGSFVKLPAGFDGDYNSLTNRPNLFSGSYNDLTDQPAIPTVPTNVSAFTNDAGYITMDSVPTIPSNVSAFTNDAGYITAQDIPEIPTVPTNVGAFTNDAGYITMDSVPTVPSNVSDFTNDAGYITAQDIPEIPTIPTNVSDFTNDAGYLTDYTETDPLFNAWGKDYNDLTNKPILFDGDYNSLTNKPTLFDGNYNSLTNKPTLFSGNYNDLSNKPVLFDWDYYSLNNRPTIPTVPTNVSAFTNDAGYITGYTENQNLSDVTAIGNSAGNRQLKNLSDPTDAQDAVTKKYVDDLSNAFQQQLQGITNNFRQKFDSLTNLIDGLNNQIDSIVTNCCGCTPTPSDTTPVTPPDPMVQTYSCAVTATHPAQTSAAFMNNGHNGVSHGLETVENGRITSVTDYDGNAYPVVQIGSQCWLAENMRCTHSPSTDTYIVEQRTPGDWLAQFTYSGKIAHWYDNDSATYAPQHYGLLYNWNAAVDVYNATYGELSINTSEWETVNISFDGDRQGICPKGWHVPSHNEWTQLTDYVSSQSEYLCNENSGSYGKALASTTGWTVPTGYESNPCLVGNNPNANNATGFGIMPSGLCQNSLVSIGLWAYFWSATQWVNSNGQTRAYYRYVENRHDHLFSNDYIKGAGMSVRCLRDESGNNVVAPNVTTGAASNITPTTAKLNGNVTSDGGASVITRGFCWGTSPMPTLSGNHTSDGSGTGDFSSTLTNLAPNTTYYIKAYATYSEGTVYGNEVTFTTPCWAVNVTISGPTEICEGQSATLTASGASSYMWGNGAVGSTITVVGGTTYSVTGRDQYNCPGTATFTVMQNNGTHNTVMVNVCDNELPYFWHGMRCTTSSTYTYSYTNTTGCASVDTLKLTVTSCTPEPQYPCEITTGNASIITPTTAIISGTVISDGGTAVTARGFCWGTTSSPTLADNHTVDGSATGDFSGVLTGLTPNTYYHVRAYATNSGGTSYGNEITFHTTEIPADDAIPCPGYETVTDYDGNTYNTVKIGQQCWMKENLKTQHYADGTAIPIGVVASSSIAYRYYPNNNSDNLNMYGYLYNWPAVMHGANGSASNPSGVQGICPTGWHVPSDAEWTQLTDYLKSIPAYGCQGDNNKIAMALAANEGWIPRDYGYCYPCNHPIQNNTSGFSAIPAGNYYGSYNTYSYFREEAYFWSATEINGSVWHRMIEQNWDNVNRTEYSKDYGLSVRCLRDPGAPAPPDTTPVNPPCQTLNITISGETNFCEGESATLTASGASTYVWGNGATSSSVTVNAGGTYTVTGTDQYGCTGTAMKTVTMLSGTHNKMTQTICSSDLPYAWHGMSYTAAGTYTYPYANSTGCASMDTLVLTVTECGVTPVTFPHPCTIPSSHSAQTGNSYQGNGFNGANYGLETVVNGQITSVTDYDGNEYPVVQIGSQCWLAENMRCTHSPSTGTYLIPAASTGYTYTGKQARWYNNESATYAPINYGLLYNWNAAVDTFNTAYGETNVNTTSGNAVSVTFSGHRRGICPAGWHLPSDAEWNTMEATVSGSDWQTSYETGAGYRGSHAGKLAGGDNWTTGTTSGAPGDYGNTDRDVSGFSAVPAGGCYGSSFNDVGYSAYFWSSSQYTGYLNYAWYRYLGYNNAGVGRYGNVDKSYGYSVRCLRDPGAPAPPDTTPVNPPCQTLNITISGETNFCEGESATLTASGASTYVWGNGATSSSVTVNEGGTYTVTGTDQYGCTGTAMKTVTMLSGTHNKMTQTICSSDLPYTWHGMSYTAAGTYTYPYANSTGCASMDTLVLTVTECGVTPVTSPHPCTVSSTHPAQTGTAYQGNGYQGANHGLETVTTDGKINSVTDYDGNEYPVVQIGSQCWLAENMRCTHSPSTGTYIVNNRFVAGSSTSTAYTFTGKMARWYNNDSVTYAPQHYGLLYNWNAAVDVYNISYGELSINNNPSYVVSQTFTGNRQGICPKGWHVPSDAEWNTMEASVSGSDWQTSYANSMGFGGRGTHAGKLAAGDSWSSSTNSGAPGDYSNAQRGSSGFAALPAGNCYHMFDNYRGIVYFWSCSRYDNGNAWGRYLDYNVVGVGRGNLNKGYGFSLRCLRDESGNTAHVPTVTTTPATNITENSATLSGSVTNPDNVTIASKGFEYKALGSTAYTQVAATGTDDSFSATVSNLAPSTEYSYRAFVTYDNNTVYGGEVTFTTLCGNVQLSIQATKTSICPGVESVTLTASGAETYTWSTNETGASITITAPGHYTVVGQDANGCEGFTDIYIYEEVCAPVPQVATLEPTHDPELYYHYLSGQIVSDNGSAVTECGFCISDGDQEHTYPNSAMSVQNWTGNTFNKVLHVSDFTEGVTYYVRAYARNSAGTGYGETVTIKWPKHPVVNLSDNDITNVTDNSAAATASVELRNCTGIVAAGFCWREIENNVYPTLEDSHTVEAGSTSDYSFSSAITGLTQGIGYIVRAYVTTDENLTVYSGSSYFTTKCGAPTFELSACGDDCVEVTYDLTNTGAMDGIGAYIQYKEAAASVNSWYVEYAFSSPYNISYFLPNTEYEIQVGSHCEFESTSWSESKYFTVPYGSSAPTPAVTSAIPCTITSGHPAQTAALGYTASGANHGLETVTSDDKINSVTDYDGNEYPVVQIGSQCWLAENLRTRRYSDGTAITPGGSSTSATTAYYYDYSSSNIPLADRGYLYNWPAVMRNSSSSSVTPSGVQGICPSGWHVPSDAEWTQLTDYVSGQSEYVCGGNTSYIAKALASKTYWNTYSGTCYVGDTPSANNATGFGALPAGYYRNNGYGTFGYNANFWSATEASSGRAWYRGVSFDYADVYRLSSSKDYGYSVRCLRDESGNTAQAPAVTTTSNITGITTSSADIVSEITSDGGATVTMRGVCWSMAHNPTLSDSYTTDGGGTGSFTSSLTGLTAGTTYFVRSYATNSMGTTYGNEVSFTTTVDIDDSHTPAGDAHTCPGAPTVTDIENNVYNTVQIGNQCWMKENLRTTRLPDGANIPSAFDFTIKSPCRLPVDGNPSYVATYGYLYNWYAIVNNGCASSTNPSGVQGICPTGWHVPSEAEWTQLFDYIKSQEEYVYGDTADHIAKAIASQTGWVASSAPGSVGNDPSANNATGFTALPAGFYGTYTGVDTVANFHFGTIVGFGTTTRASNNITRVYSFGFQNFDKGIIRYDDGLNVYSSVRCLRDKSAPSSSQADLVPDVSTLSVLNVTSTTADVSGQLTNGDAADVTTCGFCVSTSHNPTVNDLCTSGNSRPNSFHGIFTDLTPNTTYYVRAFAQNCNGIFYGNEISFTTLLCDDVTVTVFDTVAKDPSSILLYESFDNSALPSNWSIIDQDGDGFNWSAMDTDFNRHTGTGCISSASWTQTAGALTPDNWLITPSVILPSNRTAYLSWYAVAQDTNYKNDHYEVRLTTASGTSTSDFNYLLKNVTSNNSQYTHYSVNLGAFAGQTVRVAFVHNNCSDEFRVNLDDISVYTGTMPVDYTENLYSTFGCDSTVHHRIVIPYSSSASSSPRSASAASHQPTSTDVVPVTRRSNERTDAHQTDTPRALGTPAVEITPVSPSERRTVGNALMKQSSR